MKPLFSADREPSNEYPDDYHGPSKDPDDGDDSPVDEGDGDENTNPDEQETEAQYWARVNRTASAIIAASRRRRGEIP